MNFDRNVNFVTQTDGKGYWSDVAKTVKVNRAVVVYIDEDNQFGELRAHFDATDWDVNTEGLIYTDKSWMNSFRECMRTLGFSDSAVNDIHYSEQGMQGSTFVSMDVGQKFLAECSPLYRFTINKVAVNT